MSGNVKNKYDVPSDKDKNSSFPRWLAPAAIGTLGVVAVIGLALLGGHKSLAPTKNVLPPAAQTTIKRLLSPRFDTVRVDAGGNAVIAGRANPGDTVTIDVNGKPIGTAKTEPDGSFVYVTTNPLSPGSAEITLEATSPNGSMHKGTQNVAVNIPNAQNGSALAVLSGGRSPVSRVLTGQGPRPGTLGIASVDYDSAGQATIAGTAPAGAQLSLFLNDTYVGSALAGKNGRWVMRVPKLPDIKPGTLTLEMIRPDGTIINSIKTAFAPLPIESVAAGQVVIKPGECLWLIARRVYGKGIKYTLIYKANEDSIQDPNLIYPGQTLIVPEPQK